jgi:hypothetical protein
MLYLSCRLMCRDELLLKTAVLGLVSLDATQQQMATLLQCYKGEVVLLADAWSLHKSAHSERRCVQPDAARSWDAWHRVGSAAAGVQMCSGTVTHRLLSAHNFLKLSLLLLLPPCLCCLPTDQPNVVREKTDAVLAILQQTRLQEKR